MNIFEESANKILKNKKECLEKASIALGEEIPDDYWSSSSNSLSRLKECLDILRPEFEEQIKEIVFEWCLK